MRSAQKDQNGYVTFSGKFYTNVVSSGVTSNGIPFIVIRSNVGIYTVRFSTSLVVISAVANNDSAYVVSYSPGIGCVSFNSIGGSGPLVDTNIYFTVTARKVVS